MIRNLFLSLLFNLELGIAATNPGDSPKNRFHVSLVYTYG